MVRRIDIINSIFYVNVMILMYLNTTTCLFVVGQIRERLEIVDVFVNDSEARKTVHEQTLPRYFIL